jgi:hypothetical protein
VLGIGARATTLPVNEEFLVGSAHEAEPITSLPLVHTARRYYRLNERVRSMDERTVAGFGRQRTALESSPNSTV